MKSKLILLLIFPFCLLSQSINHSEKLAIKKKVLGLNLKGEIDLRTNESGPFHRHYDAGFSLPFLDTWSLSIQYRSVFRKKDGQWDLEKRPHATIEKVIVSNKIKWSLKSRQEYRIRKNRDDALRNRIRIMAKSQYRFFNLKPYIGNEFFYDMEKNEYNKNWTVFGFDLNKKSFGTPSIYYKYVLDLIDNRWQSTYMLVFKLSL